jgi:hypothetical protein
LSPKAMEGFWGATLMVTRVGGVTLKLADPLTEPDVARMLTDPAATLLAKPWLPGVSLTVATVPSEELQ